MEWLWSFVTAIFGWWIGHRESIKDRGRGVEECAQAAFSIEHSLVGFILERDRQRLKDAFKDVDLSDTKQVHAVAQSVGSIYAEIIRCEAFADARDSNFSKQDCEAWQRTFDKEMPPVGYKQGYLQAIVDVIAGVKEYAPKYFEEQEATSLVARIDQSQRMFAGPPAGFYLDNYDPNGRALGADLLVGVVTRTFHRAEKERGAISVTAGDSNQSLTD